MKSSPKNKIPLAIIALASVIYTITAINSHGFYHADEHYQIIEFAGLKLGTHTPDELAWEFKNQIRPSIQPATCYVFIKALNFLSIDNPYHQASFLRFLSAILAIVSISYFIRSTSGLIKDKYTQIAYYLLSYFLWFIPVISVRFSSETWSGLLFLLSLAFFLNNSTNKFKPYQIGFTLGLSFLFRFQIAFAIVGFVLWLIIMNKTKLKYLLKISISICAVIVLGVFFDTWFYGELVFTPWNYFYKNIIEGAAAGFGTSAWYYYVLKLLSHPGYIIGIPIMASFLIITLSNPKNILLWCSLSFFIGHSIISHKEERFLFPIVYLFPLMLIESYLVLKSFIKNRNCFNILRYTLSAIFITTSIVGIAATTQKSAGIGRMEITKYIHDHYNNKKINLVFCSWANPYNPWHSLPMKFYQEDSLTERRISNLCELNDSLYCTDGVNLLIIRKTDKENNLCAQTIQANKFVFETQSVPPWIEKLNKIYYGFDNHSILELYSQKDFEQHSDTLQQAAPK